MLADYHKVLSLLSSCTSAEVTDAQHKLSDLASRDIQVMMCLRLALRDSVLTKQMKIMAASHINKQFNENTIECTQAFCLNYFEQLLGDAGIELRFKKELSRALMCCLERCDTENLTLWKEMTLNYLLDQSRFQVGLLMLTAFSCSEINNNLVQQLDETSFIFTMRMLCGKLGPYENVEQIAYILQTWKVVLEYLQHFAKKSCRSLCRKMANSEQLTQALQAVYAQYTLDNHYLYLNDQDYELTSQVNQMKKAALELHYLVLHHAITSGRNNRLYQFTGMNLQNYVNTLCYVSLQRGILLEYQLEEVVILMLKILRCMAEDSPQILSKSWKQLVHYILLPFLYVDEQELEDFEENTTSFIEVSEDCCEKQRMGILKTEVASFVEKMADIGDEIASYSPQLVSAARRDQPLIAKYLINFAVASIKDCLHMQRIDQNEFLMEQGMPEGASVLPLETAFLLLSIFSYCIENYPQELEDIRVVLYSEHIRSLPPLERARIYTFLAYNYEEILVNAQMPTIKYWVELAFMEEQHPTTAYCALDFITNSLQKIYDESVVALIISKIPTTQSVNFWALLKKLTHLYVMKFTNELLSSLVTTAYQRIQIEIQTRLQTSEKVRNTHTISNLLHVIRIISEKGELVASRSGLRGLLWEIVNLYPTALRNYFEDDVVKIINCFLFYASKEELSHPDMLGLLGMFIREFERTDFEMTYYYVAFNNFVMGGEFATVVAPIYHTLEKSLAYFMDAKRSNRQALKKKLPVAHTLLVLQNILALHGTEFSPETLCLLHSQCTTLYPHHKQSKSQPKPRLVIYDRTLLARALNLQLLCHMYHPSPELLTHLVKYHDYKIFYGYDVSVLMGCMRVLIVREKDIGNLVEMLQVCIRVMVGFRDMEADVRISQVNEKERNQQQESDSEGRIEEEEHVSEAKRKRESMIVRIKKSLDFETILSYTTTPFTKQHRQPGHSKPVKQYQQVRRQLLALLTELLRLNPALYESILTGMPQQMRGKLELICEAELGEIVAGRFHSEDGEPRRKVRILRVRERVGEGDLEAGEGLGGEGLEVRDEEVVRRGHEPEEQYEEEGQSKNERTATKRRNKIETN